VEAVLIVAVLVLGTHLAGAQPKHTAPSVDAD
jgi:hypothetical protein